MTAARRETTPDFPKGVTPSQAVYFALSICGVHPASRLHNLVDCILQAIDTCGFVIVPKRNVVPFKPVHREKGGGDHAA